MIVNLKELGTALSKINDMVSSDKNMPGVLFNITPSGIDVRYTDGNTKVISEHVNAEMEDGDVYEAIVFNYQAIMRIIDSCKPTGKIKTETVKFTFCENQIVKIRAEKYITITLKNGETVDKCASVVEQSINWVKADSSIKVKVLSRGGYEMLKHYDTEEEQLSAVKAMHPGITDDMINELPKPKLTSEWVTEADEWDANELRSIMSRLSSESGKLVYVSPKSKKAFVQNTSHVICMPVKSNISHRIIQSTTAAKALASIIGRSDTETIFTHVIDNDIVVYGTEDGNSVLSLRNMKQDNSNITQVNACMSTDYTQYMLNFNKEVLQSCIGSAKTAGASDKMLIKFERHTDDNDVEQIKMIIGVKNTGNSTDNKYEIISEYFIDTDEKLTGISIAVNLETIYMAVSKCETDYIAFDINAVDCKAKMVRVAEIDLDMRRKVAEDNGVEGSWGTEFTQEHRAEILGYTTYFAVSND